MNTDTTKRYRLLKDLPYVKAFAIYERNEHGSYCCDSAEFLVDDIYHDTLANTVVENNPDWFEELLPVSEPVKERIKVTNFIGNEKYPNPIHKEFIYSFETSVIMPLDKRLKINNLLERYLNGEMDNPLPSVLNNDTVVPEFGRDAYERLFEQNQELMNMCIKMKTESEVDAIRADTWKAARSLTMTDFHHTPYAYRAFSDYLSSLNSNDTGKEEKTDNGDGIDEITILKNRIKELEKQQPTNDNAFWTDELVGEFACDLRNNREKYEKEYKSWRDSMAEFKQLVQQSKQSTPVGGKEFIAPASLAEHPQCKKPPLGLVPIKLWRELRLDDINAAIQRYIDAHKEIPQEWINEKQALQSFLQEASTPVAEPLPTKQEWEVTKMFYKNNHSEGESFLCSDGLYRCGDRKYTPHNGSTFENMLKGGWQIHSVKRLSDNVVLTVMEGVYGSTERTDGYPNKPIKKFFIKEGLMYAQFDEGHGNNDGCLPITSIKKQSDVIQKYATPSKPTEENNLVTGLWVDIGKGSFDEAKQLGYLWQKFQPKIISCSKPGSLTEKPFSFTLKEFIKKFIGNNTLIRLWKKEGSGHREFLDGPKMEWELSKGEHAEKKVLYIKDITVLDSKYPEAVNIVVE